jgi:hypothetical protein
MISGFFDALVPFVLPLLLVAAMLGFALWW